jgi:hypothetical protein
VLLAEVLLAEVSGAGVLKAEAPAVWSGSAKRGSAV